MLNIIHEHGEAFRLAHIDEYKLGEISKRAIREHAKVGETHATRISAADKKTDATLEEAYLIKPFNEFASDENLPKIAETLAEALTNIGIHVDKKKVEEAFRKAKPVVESLVKETYMNPTHELVSSSIDEHQYLLTGIKNNKELRQFLVELGGRNVESLTHVPLKSETPVRKNLMNSETPNSLTLEAHNLLGILSGLKFAGYSHEAVERALRELDARVDELMREKNLELLGLYLGFQRLLEKRDFEGAEEFLRGLS